MKIRPAGVRDLDAWAAMRERLWPEAAATVHELEARAMLEKPERWAAFVAEEELGRLVGFAEASLREDPLTIERVEIGFLEGWWVERHARRKRIGAQLIEAVEAWVRERGCTTIDSDAEIDNVTSRRAHEALGYVAQEESIRFRKKL